MRFIGLDIHRDFCEVAIAAEGEVRSAGRIETSPAALELFAQSLGANDQVALEATGNALAITRILEPHVGRVVIANARALRALSSLKAKTDRLDARTLAELLAAGLLPAVWAGDEETRALRRRISRRAQLVKQRSRAKNEIHAVLTRNLKQRPPVSDLFGKGGRRWLATLELPLDERQTVDGCLRQVDFLDGELALIDRAIAEHALRSREIRRLLTIPGVDVTVAAAFMACVGDIARFPTPRHLVSYLGLDPKVRQSGIEPARHGRISKQGSSQARCMLVEAAWLAVRTPGPLRAFGERIRNRRGPQVATVAVARKLVLLAWHMLTSEQDYAFARPSLTRFKLRRLELRTGAERLTGRRPSVRIVPTPQQTAAEREVAAQAEATYRRLVKDWQQQAKSGAGAAPGRAFLAARQGQAPDPALSLAVARAASDSRKGARNRPATT
jgi:transposase